MFVCNSSHGQSCGGQEILLQILNHKVEAECCEREARSSRWRTNFSAYSHEKILHTVTWRVHPARARKTFHKGNLMRSPIKRIWRKQTMLQAMFYEVSAMDEVDAPDVLRMNLNRLCTICLLYFVIILRCRVIPLVRCESILLIVLPQVQLCYCYLSGVRSEAVRGVVKILFLG